MEPIEPLNPEPELSAALGEPLSQVLDMRTWGGAAELGQLYASLREVVKESVEREKRVRGPLREFVSQALRSGKDRLAPANAGLYRLTSEEVAEIHAGLLFNGAVECCDGTIAAHDSVLLTVMQIGVSMVSYQGRQGNWVQRFYRRDVQATYPDPVAEAHALFERRSQPDEDELSRQPLSRLLGHALMDYAERAALLELSEARWRMGHGSPIPVTLQTPTNPELVARTIDVVSRLVYDHRRFVYVVSEPADRLLLTIGDALEPLEFAVVETLAAVYTDGRLERLAAAVRGHRTEMAAIQRFLREVRPEIVRGVYRAGPHSPARVFYAHREFACEAAAIAIADSLLQPNRGFPMLIDLADLVCRNTFDGGSFRDSVQDAYAAAKEPSRYLGERETRS